MPTSGVGTGGEEVQRGGGGALRADAGGGAPGVGGRAASGCGDAAAVDAGRGIVESGAEAATTPAKTRAQGTLGRDGADGREFSRLAGGTWPGRVLDRFDRRCHEHHAGPVGRARDDLGGGHRAACLDWSLRGALGAVRRLEESLTRQKNSWVSSGSGSLPSE